MGKAKKEPFLYSGLTGNKDLINLMGWEDVNNKIYGASQLSSNNFWNYYGTFDEDGVHHVDEYKVDVSVVIDAAGNTKCLNPTKKYADVGTPFVVDELEQEGIFCYVSLGKGDTQTSMIKFELNNLAKTDVTYYNVDGKGAKYTVTITIPSKDKTKKGDIIITQDFYVKNDYSPYGFNPNYYKNGNVETKGKKVGNKWVMQQSIEEAFEMKNGKTVYQYFADNNNVLSTPAIKFDFVGSHPGVDFDSTNDHIVKLTTPLAENEPSRTVTMRYTIQLVNGETKTNDFKIIFYNPFKSASPIAAVELDGTKIGKVSANASKNVKVVDLDNATIYSWVTNALKLSDLAKSNDGYCLVDDGSRDDMVNVSYRWSTAGDYNSFVGNLAPDAVFTKTFTDNQDAVIEYDNLGATLRRSVTLYLEAVVTFENISKVKVTIPVKIKGND